MKVILLKDVARIGRRFEVREVPDGHAQNFLIPRKLAEVATPQSLRRLEERKLKQSEGELHRGENFAAALERFKAHPPTMTVEANEKGHLFKGVRAEDIAASLSAQGAAIEAKHVKLSSPIKELGAHEIELEQGGKKGTITLTLERT